MAGRERSRTMDEMYAGYAEVNRVNLLKTVYLYGNNGAGKSKVRRGTGTCPKLENQYFAKVFPQSGLMAA